MAYWDICVFSVHSLANSLAFKLKIFAVIRLKGVSALYWEYLRWHHHFYLLRPRPSFVFEAHSYVTPPILPDYFNPFLFPLLLRTSGYPSTWSFASTSSINSSTIRPQTQQQQQQQQQQLSESQQFLHPSAYVQNARMRRDSTGRPVSPNSPLTPDKSKSQLSPHPW